MQPTEREMQGAQAAISCLNGLGSRIRLEEQQQKPAQGSDLQQAGCESSHDDFFDHILFNLPWTDLSSENSKPAWDLNPPEYPLAGLYDESTLLACRLKQNQITGGGQLDLISRHQSLLQVSVPTDSALLPDGSPCPSAGEGMNTASIGSLQFHQTQAFNGGSTAAPPKQKVRARRGQATDPHSIAERLRRERIAERMKALQELVPNANKTDKASMLDEIIDYVKFLQLQVKVLSMSRLGGVASFAADVSSKRENEGMTAAEQQVAKLMEEDMGAAMQYLQGKGLCLMPISLASVVSAATNSTISDISLSSANHHSS